MSCTGSPSRPIVSRSLAHIGPHLLAHVQAYLNICDASMSFAVCRQFFMAAACSRLTHLDLGAYRRSITDATVIRFAQNCPHLTSVNFNYCDKLTDASVIELAKNCSHLTTMSFSDCNKLTDLAAEALAEGCPYLMGVSFSGCNKLSNAAVIALAESCSELIIVNLLGCNQLTVNAGRALAEHCPNLVRVFIPSCDVIAVAVAAELAAKCSKLSILHVGRHSFYETDIKRIRLKLQREDGTEHVESAEASLAPGR